MTTMPLMPPPSPADQQAAEAARASLTRLRTEVAKAVVGQDATVTGLVIALLCQGHVLLEGVPGVAKTLLVRAHVAVIDPRDDPGAVHPRPDAGRRDRVAGLRRAQLGVRVPQGPGLHQPAACGRDQPHATQDPGLAARGDGGTPGHRRRAVRSRCPTRSSSSPRRTRWSTRAPTPCPRRSSTGSSSSSPCRCPSARTRSPCWQGITPVSTRATSRQRGSRAVAGSAELEAGQGRRSPGLGTAGGAGLHRRRVPGDAYLAVVVPGRLAAWCDGDAQHRQGLGVVVRPRLRHP